jgi:N-formylglutamate amidohydrolase
MGAINGAVAAYHGMIPPSSMLPPPPGMLPPGLGPSPYLHSFGMPLKVDVVLGDRRGATAGEYEMQIIEESFGAHGFSTQRNQPFPGGWIIRRFESNPCIHAIIVELNQRLYLDPAEIDREDWKRPRLVPERMREASKRLKAVLVDIVGGLGEIKPRSCVR